MTVLILAITLNVLAGMILVAELVPSVPRSSSRRQQRAIAWATFQAEDQVDQLVARTIDEMLQAARTGKVGSGPFGSGRPEIGWTESDWAVGPPEIDE